MEGRGTNWYLSGRRRCFPLSPFPLPWYFRIRSIADSLLFSLTPSCRPSIPISPRKLDDGKIQKLRDANITDSLSLYYALGCNARCEALRKILGEVKFQKLGTEKEKFISELRSALPKEKRHYDGMPEDEASLLAQYRQEIRNARREKMDKVHGLALRIDHESSLDWVIVMDLTGKGVSSFLANNTISSRHCCDRA